MLPQTPLDCVLLAVGTAAGVIIAIALQDFFLDSRVPNPKIRALQDVVLLLSSLEAARRVHLPRTLVDDPKPKAFIYRDYKNRTGMFLPFAFRRLPARA